MEGFTPSKTTLLRRSHKHQAPRIMTLLKPFILLLCTFLRAFPHRTAKEISSISKVRSPSPMSDKI
ncbi:hypothetical protein ZEAMMB73_Zm00001d022350 [Zea mays]|uniref:Uncharacterized protein n=1 Tax=Zea mays TaxID=4577 RepID=A0A1D6ILB8_MAIZE|nr:hypothetical protein ZEAMMB73_Zm00001d022350 [Zea mays]